MSVLEDTSIIDFKSNVFEEQIKCGEFFLSKDYITWRLQCIYCSIAYSNEIEDFIDHLKIHLENYENSCQSTNSDLPPESSTITEVDVKIEPIEHCNENEFDENDVNELDSYLNEFQSTQLLQFEENNELIQSSSDDFNSNDTLEVTKKRNKSRNTRKVRGSIKYKIRSTRQFSDVECDICQRNLFLDETIETHRINFHDFIDSSVHNAKSLLENNKTIPCNDNEIRRIDPLKCNFCSKRLSSASIRAAHERTHTGEKPYECELCNKRYSGHKSLLRHKKYHDNANTSNQRISDIRCEICEINLSIDETIEEHRSHYHDFIDPQISNAYTPLENNNKISRNNNEIRRLDPRVCKFCSKRSSSAAIRAVHERVHTGEKPYECDICKKRFVDRKYLKTHKSMHNNTKTFKCQICKFPVVSMKQLKEHMTTVHDENEKFKCDYCPRTFFRKEYKNLHERVHTGERPFQCNECGKTFLRRTNLTAHARRHAGIKPYKCPYCEKCFFEKDKLRNHIVVHTGERPYACDICTKTCPTKKSLLQHKQIHSNIRAYVCQICGKSYKQHSGLHTHKKTCHDLASLTI